MKKFDLLTEQEKSSVNNAHAYSEIMRAELNKGIESKSKSIRTPKFRQLKAYQEQVRQEKNNTRIRLKFEALNMMKDFKREIYETRVNPDLEGCKILNTDCKYAKKYAANFEEKDATTDPTTGTVKSYYFTKSRYHIYANLKIKLKSNGVEHEEEKTLYLYHLDDLKVKYVYDFEDEKSLDFEQETKNASEFIKYLAESQKKLNELKNLCNSELLITIQNNQ